MRRFTVATLVLAGGLLTACDGDSTGNGGSIVGTYTLQTFNSMNLQAELPGGVTGPGGEMIEFELTAGSVRLNSGNTCSVSVTIRTTSTDATGKVTVTTDIDSDPCTYSVTGTTIRLIEDPEGRADLTTGSISGNTLTLVNAAGNIFVFTK